MDTKTKKKLQNTFIVMANVLFILLLIVVFVEYENDYKRKLYNQNVDDISNINQASANISSSFFSSRQTKLKDLALYIKQNNLTLEQTMEYINNTNSDNKALEIIGKDYKGYRIVKNTQGDFVPVDYSSGYRNIQYMLDSNISKNDTESVCFVSEFTDYYTAMKSFALYMCVDIKAEDGSIAPYTLMIVADSKEFSEMINLKSGYDNLSTVIINQQGEYIIGNSDFESNNFYKYLYMYNNLTLDEQNDIKSEVISNGKGNLEYHNSHKQDCVFVYAQLTDKGWYSVSTLPVSEFHNKSFDISFTAIVIVILLVLLMIDMLYLATLNRQLKENAENAKVANEAKTDFLSRMSHDIRTPLNVIIGMSMLAQNEDNPEETKRCLKDIDESGKFLLGLVNDILDLNKVESGKMEVHPEPYCFEEFCKHIKVVVAPLCQSKNIDFELIGNMPKNVYVMLDHLRVNQIFFNLLSNSAKFTPSGGKIQLKCNAKELENDKVAFDFEVHDNGIGMSKEFQKHMFESFSQEHREETSLVQGTGLGLAIVFNLIKLMDGELRVESEIGTGTTFYVHIETCYAEKQNKKAVEGLQGNILEGKRILLFEDHPLNARIAMTLLENKKMKVEHAENGSIGLEMFSSKPENYYDAILMDIRMPVMNGLETTRNIRALKRQDVERIPIIAMTANAYDSDKKNCLDAGMNAHIAKPINPDIMYETLEIHIMESLKNN